MKTIRFLFVILIGLCACSDQPSKQRATNDSTYPAIHFTSLTKWTQEPISLIFTQGKYHLFYQKSEKASNEKLQVGLATSSDLIHWNDAKLQDYTNLENLNYINIVKDTLNLCRKGNFNHSALVALCLTKEKASLYFQESSDNGETWQKIDGKISFPKKLTENHKPTLFQDSKNRQWIIILPEDEKVEFYQSNDILNWKLSGSFQKKHDAFNNKWLKANLKQVQDSAWILFVDVNQNAPNNGSGVQYFVGRFDGKDFSSNSLTPHWLDYGRDNIGTVICDGLPENKVITLSLMENLYNKGILKSENWNGMMTLPKEISVKKIYDELLICAKPIQEIQSIRHQTVKIENQIIEGELDLSDKVPFNKSPIEITLKFETVNVTRLSFPPQFGIRFENSKNENLSVGYDYFRRWYFVDRTNLQFSKENPQYGGVQMIPCFRDDSVCSLHLIIDNSSVELFTEDGKLMMSEVYMAENKFNKLFITAENGYIKLLNAKITELKSIWN